MITIAIRTSIHSKYWKNMKTQIEPNSLFISTTVSPATSSTKDIIIVIGENSSHSTITTDTTTPLHPRIDAITTSLRCNSHDAPNSDSNDDNNNNNNRSCNGVKTGRNYHISFLGNALFVVLQLLFYFETSGATLPHRKLGGVSLECGGVFLTVSSLWRSSSNNRGLRDSELEMNWELACDGAPEWSIPNWAGLFNKDPIAELTEPLVRIDIKDHPWGFYKTNISYGKPFFPNGWQKEASITTGDDDNEYVPPAQNSVIGPHCMGYWIASFNNQTLIKVSCLKIQPTWMYDHRMQLGYLPIGSVFIPGTHNSGCYYKGSQLSRRDTFQRYILTQDRDIWSQLVHGIRYLDLRVGFYPGSSIQTDDENSTSIYSSYKLVQSIKNFTKKIYKYVTSTYYYFFPSPHQLWVNHDLVRVMPLLPLIRDVRKFLELSKGEIVILDFHRFPVGFHGRRGNHQVLLNMLQKELGHLILPPLRAGSSMGPTLNDIWSTNRRLIVCYGDEYIAKETSWLWGPLHQFWGNQQTPVGLKTYLQNILTNPSRKSKNPLWAAMAQLTPTTIDVMFKPSGSLREMADSINRNLTTWIRTKWWRLANIVATDFFLGNNIIDLAINSNVYKITFP